MTDIEELNHRFAIGSQVSFKELAAGVVVAEVDSLLATATISLYGGHVISWRPRSQIEPVLWMAKLAQFKPGKAIRGGVPICWPWFGAHQSNLSFPSHGFARIAGWQLSNVRLLDNGDTEVQLSMIDPRVDSSFGALQIRLSMHITIGEHLAVALTTENKGANRFMYSEGLHTYFNVGNVSRVSVSGLEDSEYVDLLSSSKRYKQNGAIRFNSELGRIYVNNKSACVIEDFVLHRRIRVDKSGSSSTAVWNPWLETASKMDDLGAVGWREMVCVETANALENAITLAAGQSHTMSAFYSVEQVQ